MCTGVYALHVCKASAAVPLPHTGKVQLRYMDCMFVHRQSAITVYALHVCKASAAVPLPHTGKVQFPLIII